VLVPGSARREVVRDEDEQGQDQGVEDVVQDGDALDLGVGVGDAQVVEGEEVVEGGDGDVDLGGWVVSLSLVCRFMALASRLVSPPWFVRCLYGRTHDKTDGRREGRQSRRHWPRECSRNQDENGSGKSQISTLTRTVAANTPTRVR
jgi:hypothetical protein